MCIRDSSREVIPGTKSAYKQLSRQLVKARQQGIFEWDFLEDRTRYTLGYFDNSYKSASDLRDLVQRCKWKLEDLDLDKLLDEMFDYLTINDYVGKWAKQPTIVEIWIEKDALAKTVEAWVDDVKIRVNKGYSSWTFIYNNVQEILQLLNEHERLVILYLGDLDPSGVDMQRFLIEALKYFNIDESLVEFKRLAITEQQVIDFNLPPRPEDAETIAKLERDTRTAKYTIPYVVELDALVVYAPDEFKQLIIEEVNKHFDEEIYEEVRKKAKKISKASIKVIEAFKRKAKERLIKM